MKSFADFFAIQVDSDRPLDAIARTIAEAFSSHHHLAMLHGVTSCHAMRMVLPYCENQQDALSIVFNLCGISQCH